MIGLFVLFTFFDHLLPLYFDLLFYTALVYGYLGYHRALYKYHLILSIEDIDQFLRIFRQPNSYGELRRQRSGHEALIYFGTLAVPWKPASPPSLQSVRGRAEIAT